MKIHAYIIAYNEEKMIRHTLSHYAFICEKVFLYDNHSTDRTVEIAREHPFVEVRQFDSGNKIDERAYQEVKNNCWKGSKADYVIVCDMDELLWSPKLAMDLSYLSERNVTIPKVKGYSMVSDSFPEDYNHHIIKHVKMGVRDPAFDKQIIFDPKRIREINYRPGAHSCFPEGNLLTADHPRLYLLHYKYLGLDYVTERHQMYAQRLSNHNKKKGYGFEYTQNHSLKDLFSGILKQAVKVI